MNFNIFSSLNSMLVCVSQDVFPMIPKAFFCIVSIGFKDVLEIDPHNSTPWVR